MEFLSNNVQLVPSCLFAWNGFEIIWVWNVHHLRSRKADFKFISQRVHHNTYPSTYKSRACALFFVINGPAKQVNFKTIIMLFKIIVRRVVSWYKVEQNKHVSYYTLKQKQRGEAVNFFYFVSFSSELPRDVFGLDLSFEKD